MSTCRIVAPFLAAEGLALLVGCRASSHEICAIKMNPPKMQDLAGAWIGFDDHEDFARLDLRSDSTGYFATTSPRDNPLYKHPAQAYRITRWIADDWNFLATLSPATTNAEPIYLQGRSYYHSFDLEWGRTDGSWKRKAVLYLESRIEGANQETRAKIRELDKR